MIWRKENILGWEYEADFLYIGSSNVIVKAWYYVSSNMYGLITVSFLLDLKKLIPFQLQVFAAFPSLKLLH